jgi:hypothetical protein
MRELAEAISQISKHNPKEYFLSWTPSWSSLEEQGETVRISPLAEEEENILEEVVPSGEVFTLDAIDLSQVTLRIPTEKSAEITLPQKTQRRVVEGRGSLSDSPTQRRSTNKTEELPPPEVSAGLSPEIENWFVLSKKMSSVSDTAELVRTRSPGDDAVPISELAVTAYTDSIASQETRPLSTVDLASMETRQLSPAEAKGVMTADLKVQNQERTQSLRSWYLSLAVCLVFGVVIGLILSQRKPTFVMQDVVEEPVLKYTPPQEEPLAVKAEEPTPSVVVAKPVVVASKKQTASLVLGSNVSCECFLNGESVGFTPCISKELQPGTYSIRLKNSAFGIEEQFSVTLAAGEEKKIRKQFSFAQ